MGRGAGHRKAVHQASRGHWSSNARRVPRVTLEEEGEAGMTFSFNNRRENTLTLTLTSHRSFRKQTFLT